MPNPPPGCNTWQEYIEKEDHNRHIRNRTGDQEATLPPTTGGICRYALEANQGDKRKRYYVLAQVWANRPQAVTPGGRKSH